MNNVTLSFWRMHHDVQVPVFGSEYATCFDLRFCPSRLHTYVDGYNQYNAPIQSRVDYPERGVYVMPQERLLLPTGLIVKLYPSTVDEKQTYSLRIHARSGMALKRGLVLANAEGVIDLDYQNEIFVLMTNISNVAQRITFNERVAQAEVVKNEVFTLVESEVRPDRWSDRSGGFGSTGVS